MALIQCPKCNKNISDTSKECVHCGFSLSNTKNVGNTKQDFDALPAKQKDSLLKEFYTEHLYYGKINDDIADTLFMLHISYIFVLISFFIYMTSKLLHGVGVAFQTELMTIALVVTLILFTIGAVTLFTCRVMVRKQIKKSYLILKKYKLWLHEKKDLEMKIYFEKSDAKYKKYFDALDVKKEVW